MDVAMLSITEIMWLAMVENVVAQFVKKRVSSTIAWFVDIVARTMFPIMSLSLVLVLFIMGSSGVDATTLMWISQAILLVAVILMALPVVLVGIYLPNCLIRVLVKDLMRPDLKWEDGCQLDRKELCVIFRCLDKDRSGIVQPDEVLSAFKKHGLRFKTDALWDRFAGRIKEICGKAGESRTGVDLDDFCKHFEDLLGSRAVRHVRHITTAHVGTSHCCGG